ncbi:MAG: type VII toxin-antitoxin system HepT family RNase toxin [Pseudonocardiaceae bacterium]
MVDQERLDRLLDRVASDLKALHGYRVAEENLLDDPTRLAAVKYHFITAIEGCARIAHHLIASEGWRIAESNADAVRTLGAQQVVPAPTAEAVARAVGFRNVLVHEYVDVDDRRVRDNLDRLADLEAFVSHVAAWSGD